ncbi:MAG: hypothetical protein ABIJ09_13550 [Pseudomonadota bacterium]
MPLNMLKGMTPMLGDSPLVSLDINDLPYLWTARLVRLSHNLYRFAVRESATVLERIADSPEVKVLLRDDLHGVVKALTARVRVLAEQDPLSPGKVLIELAFDPA